MLASHAALRKQSEIYNLGIKIQLKHPRKIPLGKHVPLIVEKSVKKTKQRKKRQQREGKEREQDEEKVKEQVEDERQVKRQENRGNAEGEMRQRIQETLFTLQKQEEAFRDMDVSSFSKSQTAAWHEALVNLNERTAEMVREAEVRCGGNHKETFVEDSSGLERQSQEEDGREKRRKKDKTSKKRNRVQYDSRGWRMQPQKSPTLHKPQSLPTLIESPIATSTETLQAQRREDQQESLMQQAPPPLPPMQRLLPPGPGTQSCPALPGRPPAPYRPVPVERGQEKFPVRLKPLRSGSRSGTPVSPLLSLLAEPYKESTARERPEIRTPETRRPVSSTSTVPSSQLAEPRQQKLLTSEVRAQRALGRVKSLQNLLSNKVQGQAGDRFVGTGGASPSSACRDTTADQSWPEERGRESSSPASRGHAGMGVASLGASASLKVRFSMKPEAVLIPSNVSGFASSSRRKEGLMKAAEAVQATMVATSHEEEQLAWEKRRKYVSEVFQKLKDETDHEIHKDSLPKALELIGFSNPDMTWVTEVFDKLTCYNTLSEDEFLMFVEYYEARQDRAGAELFKKYDSDGSGTMEVNQLANLLRCFGITPMAKVIQETIKEVADVGSNGPPTVLTLAQTKRLMDVLRQREGFTLEKYTIFLQTFHRYNRNNTGEMKTQEVLGALGFLGYHSDPQTVAAVCNEVDVDRTGTINEREFVVLMRKIHEREIVQAQEAYRQLIATSPEGKVQIREVQELLKILGYLTPKAPIVEAAEGAGIYRLQNESISFEDFYLMLEVFRSREGFSRAESKSIKLVFDAHDKDKDGELTHLELGRALRQLGYVANGNMQQKLVAEVDIDGSGSIDWSEMLKLIRKFNEWDVQKSRKEFDVQVAMSRGTAGESPEAPVPRTLTDRQMRRAMVRLGIRESGSSSSSESDADENSKQRAKQGWRRTTTVVQKALRKEKRYDIWAFIAMSSRFSFKTRAFMKKTYGISPAELAHLKACFGEYDKDGSGEISDKELRLLLESIFPQLATSKESRPQLVRLLDKADSDRSGTLNFDDFLSLVNQCHDLKEQERLQKEQKAIRETGFAPEEVQGFRELFMGDVERLLLSFDDLKEMMSGVVPLGHKNSLELEAVFKPIASQTDAGQSADFSDFLHIMRRLLDTNFAGLEEHARRAATTARHE